ncbi:MAG: MFS family permease/MFS family permease [Chloroflexi bacterium]|nr:MAG: MFS family permease/MFS family permease [Chloroflexota bacterium]
MQRKQGLYYGWVIVVVAALAGYASTVQMHSVAGVFLKPITEDMGWSRTAFTSVITLGTILAAFTAPFVGSLVDRHGARWVLTIGLAMLATSMMFVAGVQSYWQFIIPIVIARIAHLGVVSTIVMGPLVPMWFIAKRGRALSIAGLGSRLGLMLNPVLVQLLINLSSWRWAMLGTGIMIAVVSILPSAIFVRKSPESVGLLPDGEAQETRDERLRLASEQSEATASQLDMSITFHQAVRHRSFYLLSIAFSLGFMIVSATGFHLVAYLTDLGLSSGNGVTALFIWSASAFVGIVASGIIMGRMNIKGIVVFNMAVMGLSFVVLNAVQSAPLAFAWAAFFGLFEGGMFVMQQYIFADYYGREFLGAIRGTIWMMQIGGNAVGALLGSIVFDATGSYTYVLATFGICSIIGAACVFFAKPPKVRQTVAASS